jgi:hypothetical protein
MNNLIKFISKLFGINFIGFQRINNKIKYFCYNDKNNSTHYFKIGV